MYAILPLLSWLGLFLIIYARGNGWRTSFLTASILWGVLLVFITELLSLRRLVTFPWVLGSWGFVVAALAVIYSRIKRRIPRPNQLSRPADFEPWSVFLLCGVISIVLITGLVAWLAPPNTDDAMSYHMSRVAHWQQNHSIAHYPTNILRQLVFPPWAEWAILHFQILSGGDPLANFVQCLLSPVAS